MKFHVLLFVQNHLDVMELDFRTFKEALQVYREASEADIWFGNGCSLNPMWEGDWRLLAYK